MIIDSLDELSSHIADKKLIVVPIFSKHDIHSSLSYVVGYYITDFNLNKSCIFPIKHSESFCDVSPTLVDEYFSTKEVFVLDGKKLLDYHDIRLILFLHGRELEEEPQFDSYRKKFGEFSSVYHLIPLSILYDEYYKFFERNKDSIDFIKNNLNTMHSSTYKSYKSVISNFYSIESNGMKTVDGWEWTEYYLWNKTGRPSNKFNKINYAALPKDDDTRKKYISRFDDGRLYLFDYTAFHPTIIANYLNVKRDSNISIHEWLGRIYFNKDALTYKEYEESKKKTFYYLYGNVSEDVMDIEFFQKASSLIDSFENQNSFISPMLKRNVSIEGYSKQKAFNYFLQCFESEINFFKISKINSLLKGLKSKLILYTYDSFLVDIAPSESHLVEDIKSILQVGGFNVTTESGFNYKEMSKI